MLPAKGRQAGRQKVDDIVDMAVRTRRSTARPSEPAGGLIAKQLSRQLVAVRLGRTSARHDSGHVLRSAVLASLSLQRRRSPRRRGSRSEAQQAQCTRDVLGGGRSRRALSDRHEPRQFDPVGAIRQPPGSPRSRHHRHRLLRRAGRRAITAARKGTSARAVRDLRRVGWAQTRAHELRSNARTIGLGYGSKNFSFVGNVQGKAGAMDGWAFDAGPLVVGSRKIWQLGYEPTLWGQEPTPRSWRRR